MPKTIRAVAISNNTAASRIISNGDASSLSDVRPYIKGLIHRLGTLGYEIGNNNYYVVDYRECAAGHWLRTSGARQTAFCACQGPFWTLPSRTSPTQSR
jgi:hypothetical protein